MGKVRTKTLGDEEQELKEKEQAEARRLAKIEEAKAKGRAEKSSDAKAMDDDAATGQARSQELKSKNQEVSAEGEDQSAKSEEIQDEPPVILSETKDLDSSAMPQNGKAEKLKKKVQKNVKVRERSAKYKTAVAQVEKSKQYTLSDALDLVEKTHLAKFDETVELHINTTGSLNGSVTLPHGTGKSTKVAILNPNKDAAGADALLKDIEGGKITFDILVATPDAMPRLAKVARILGPKGLMPNPKNGTVTPNPEGAAEKYAGGHMTFKTEAKAPVLHLTVGKLSFGQDKLTENIKAALKAVDSKNIRNVTLKSTMSPGIKLSLGK